MMERIEKKMKIVNLMYDYSLGSMSVLIMMTQISKKLYHQDTKDIPILLLMNYIISWR